MSFFSALVVQGALHIIVSFVSTIIIAMYESQVGFYLTNDQFYDINNCSCQNITGLLKRFSVSMFVRKPLCTEILRRIYVYS